MTSGQPTTGIWGIRFRSRLEARWAAFFTLLKWPYQYEPDLGLDKWIPDFVITAGSGLLVEVKPVVRLKDFAPHTLRVEASGTVAPVLIVGASLFYEDHKGRQVSGFLGMDGGSHTWYWEPVTLQHIATAQVGRDGGKMSVKEVQHAWIMAGNELQWRKT